MQERWTTAYAYTSRRPDAADDVESFARRVKKLNKFYKIKVKNSVKKTKALQLAERLLYEIIKFIYLIFLYKGYLERKVVKSR